VPEVVFLSNELRTYEPELATRLETEVREGTEDSGENGPLHCRITERRVDRAMISVHLEGQGWNVNFSVSTPPAAGEVKLETRKALRDRGRRVVNYRRATRR